MLNQRWTRIASEIMDLYRQLDEDVAIFSRQAGLHCPPGCGACCVSPHVEATVAEMLPLALWLFEQGEVEKTLERLRQGSPLCVQYEARREQPNQGRCLAYAQRPVLCRLFGYMGSRDKTGQMRYAACRVFQKTESARIQNIEAELKHGTLPIPTLASAHERVAEIGELLGAEMLPLNQALLQAIEMIGLGQQLQDMGGEVAC